MARKDLIQHRRDTAANWASVNPVLAASEMGFETDSLQFKFGDGVTAWNSLNYASNAPAFLPMVAGQTYQPSVQANTTTTAPTANRLLVLPFYVANRLTATALSVVTGTVVTAGSARLGIYNTATNGQPNALVVDAGTVSYTTSATSYSATISTILNPGWYWLGVSVTSGSSTWLGIANGANNQGSGVTQRSYTPTSSNGVTGYYVDGVTGALPTTPTWTFTNSAMIMPKITF